MIISKYYIISIFEGKFGKGTKKNILQGGERFYNT